MMDFVARMELGRTLAKQRRDRGLHTGKSAAGWNYKRPAAERGSWDAATVAAMSDWQSACREALNDFRVEAMNGAGHDVYTCDLI